MIRWSEKDFWSKNNFQQISVGDIFSDKLLKREKSRIEFTDRMIGIDFLIKIIFIESRLVILLLIRLKK